MYDAVAPIAAGSVKPLGIDGWKFELFATDGRTTPYVSDPVAASFGVFDQAHAKVMYEAVKTRDAELTFHATFEPTDEQFAQMKPRGGRPKLAHPKVAVTVRYDAEIIDRFRASGDGRQTRMNDALRDWLKTHRV